MTSRSAIVIIILTTSILIVSAMVISRFSKDYFKSTEVDPSDFGGKNKRVAGTAEGANFAVGDYIDIRNTTGFFASTVPDVGPVINPLSYRLQPISNTLIFYQFGAGVLYPPIEPGAVAAYFIMRPQGDAILLSPDGKILWSTQTTTGNLFVFGTDGDIKLYDANNKVVWQQSNAEFQNTAFKSAL